MTPDQLSSAIKISRALARKYGRGDRAWTDDLMQSALAQIVLGCSSYKPNRGSWDRWVSTVAYGAIMFAFRKRGLVGSRNHQCDVDSLDTILPGTDGCTWLGSLEGEEPSPDRLADARRRLQLVIGALSEQELSLCLAGTEALSCSAVAREAGITPSAVNQWRQAALAKARKAVRGRLGRTE